MPKKGQRKEPNPEKKQTAFFLEKKYRDYIREEVEAGRYQFPAQVIRAALDKLMEK